MKNMNYGYSTRENNNLLRGFRPSGYRVSNRFVTLEPQGYHARVPKASLHINEYVRDPQKVWTHKIIFIRHSRLAP